MSIIKICDYCGKEFKTYACYEKRNRKHRFCSKKCEGEFRSLHNTPDNWKGGTIGSTTGYVYIQLNGKQVEEHRLVMEKYLERKLAKDEVVHHINGIKTDNRIENLAVMTRTEHQRLHHKTGRIRECLRCGLNKEIHGRGLCATCYHYELMHKELERWSVNTIPKKQK